MKKKERQWKYVWEENKGNKKPSSFRKIEKPVLPRPMKFEFEFSFPSMKYHPSGFSDLNMDQTDNDLIARISMPGFTKNDIELTLSPDSLNVKAEKKRADKSKNEHKVFAIMKKSVVQKSFHLPVEIVPEKSKATLEKGVLTITMPKKERKRFNLFG